MNLHKDTESTINNLFMYGTFAEINGVVKKKMKSSLEQVNLCTDNAYFNGIRKH